MYIPRILHKKEVLHMYWSWQTDENDPVRKRTMSGNKNVDHLNSEADTTGGF